MSSYCRKNNWSTRNETLLNQIINLELTAAHIYTAMAAHFSSDRHYWPGLAKFFKDSSSKENEEAAGSIRYQIIRGGTVELDQIERPSFDESSTEHSIMLQAITYTLELTQSIYCSYTPSHTSSDPDRSDDIQLNDFLKEQQKGRLSVMYDLGCMLSQIAAIGNDGFGLWTFDQKLLR